MPGTGSMFNLKPINALQYLENICVQDVSTVIFLVNTPFLKDYVEV